MASRGVLAFGLVLEVACALAAGCGPPPAPDAPSYDVDVKPILLARCVRCHGAGGMLRGDPAGSVLPGPPPDGYFDHYADVGDCSVPDSGIVSPTCRHGALTFATAMAVYLKLNDIFRMPPPPAPPLTSRQRDIIERWAAETPPQP